jgi:hypothetical protein
MEQTSTNPSAGPIVFDKEESKYRLVQENFITPAERQTLINLVENHG